MVGICRLTQLAAICADAGPLLDKGIATAIAVAIPVFSMRMGEKRRTIFPEDDVARATLDSGPARLSHMAKNRENPVPKHILLTFTENNVTARAELLENSAPRTCTAIWNGLSTPAVNNGIHSMYVGRGVAFNLPPPNQSFRPEEIPPENQIIIPMPGDICFTYFRPYELNSPGHDSGSADAVFDITVFYGRNARLFASQGWLPCNLFAKIVGDIAPFAEMCTRLRNEGKKEIRITRDPAS